MLLEGSELTKEDRESQLYNESKRFRQHKKDSIDDYYVRLKKAQEKDKIGSKPDKNGKCGEAEKSLKQLQ
nr:integrase, catalytic region, zinc finger, CCHC-type, peptidase aspartic, catalytic [Tanacetum cinerariifolium]